MNEFAVTFRPIGVIRSEHVCAQETPIQSNYAKGCQGRAVIFLEYAEGLRDLDATPLSDLPPAPGRTAC